MGDEATETIAEPSVPVTKVTMVLADATVDSSAIPAPQVENVVEETCVLEIDAGIQSIQSKLPATILRKFLVRAPLVTYSKSWKVRLKLGKSSLLHLSGIW